MKKADKNRLFYASIDLRQVARHKRLIQKLKDLNESLEHKNASLRKKYSRLNQKCNLLHIHQEVKHKRILEILG